MASGKPLFTGDSEVCTQSSLSLSPETARCVLSLLCFSHSQDKRRFRNPFLVLKGEKMRRDPQDDMISNPKEMSLSSLFATCMQIDQSFRIFEKLGTPTPDVWPSLRGQPDWNDKFPKFPPQVRCCPAILQLHHLDHFLALYRPLTTRHFCSIVWLATFTFTHLALPTLLSR